MREMPTPTKVYAVQGLAYGDEGKGTTVDFLCRKHNAKLVVRFSSGPQAAHHVVLPDGRWHCFSQFGAGSFVPHVRTLLSKYMIFQPFSFAREAERLAVKLPHEPLDHIFIDQVSQPPPNPPDSHLQQSILIVTPLHRMLNRISEISRGTKRQGTCGVGVGCTATEYRHTESGVSLGVCQWNDILTRRAKLCLSSDA